jgi:hypothetical protein
MLKCSNRAMPLSSRLESIAVRRSSRSVVCVWALVGDRIEPVWEGEQWPPQVQGLADSITSGRPTHPGKPGALARRHDEVETIGEEVPDAVVSGSVVAPRHQL